MHHLSALRSRPGIKLLSAAILALLMLFSSASPALAASVSKYPDETGSSNYISSDISWGMTDHIKTDNDVHAAAYLSAAYLGNTAYSERLQGWDFDFSIPSNATITGIQVEIERNADGANAIKDEEVKLLKNGALTGSNMKLGSWWANGSSEVATYGGSDNLWGSTWTPADINNNNFGVSLACRNYQNYGRLAQVDYVRITVTYTTPAAATTTVVTSSTNPSTYGNSVTFTASVTPNPGANGTIQFKDGTSSLGSPITLDSSGKATYTTSALSAASHSITAVYSGTSSYSTSTSAALNQVVNKRAITVTAATDSKIYDGTTASTGVPTITTGTLATGDTAVWTQTFNNKNVGTAKTLTPAGVVSDGNSGNNYSVSFVNNTTGVITARAITVTAATDSKIYDGTTASAGVPTITTGTLATGDTVVWTQTYNNKNVGIGKTLTPAGVVSDGNSGNNYSVSFVNNTTGVITARAITVTAATDSKIYDGTTASTGLPTITTGALASGDSAVWTQTFNNKNVGTAKTLTPAGVVSDGNSGNNYSVSFVNNTTGVITARAITVTADNQLKYINESDPVLTYHISAGTLAAGDAFSGTLTREFGLVPGFDVIPGNYAILQGTLTLGGNYNLTFVPGILTVAVRTYAVEPPATTTPPVTVPPTTTTTPPVTTTAPPTTTTTPPTTTPPTTTPVIITTTPTITTSAPPPTTTTTPPDTTVTSTPTTTTPVTTTTSGGGGSNLGQYLGFGGGAGALLIGFLFFGMRRRGNKDQK